MKYLENICQEENILFDAINSHCRCIAHIMNLTVQEILKQIKAGEAQTEDDILNNMDATITAGEIIPKVSLLFYNLLRFSIIIIIIFIIIFNYLAS